MHERNALTSEIFFFWWYYAYPSENMVWVFTDLVLCYFMKFYSLIYIDPALFLLIFSRVFCVDSTSVKKIFLFFIGNWVVYRKFDSKHAFKMSYYFLIVLRRVGEVPRIFLNNCFQYLLKTTFL